MNNEEISPNLDDPQEIARQVADTQAALTDKIEALKEQVSSSFDNAEASVLETVDTVKKTFSIKSQVERHPWGWMAGSVAIGVVVGMKLAGSNKAARYTPQSIRQRHLLHSASPKAEWQAEAQQQVQALSHDRTQDDSILSEIRDVSIGTLLTSARDMAKSALPTQFSGVIENIFNRTSSKLLKNYHSRR